MIELKTEHLFDAHFTVAPSPADWMVAGDGGYGTRVIAPVTGGTFEGPKLKGTARNFGADWLLIRHDNVAIVDVRIVLETEDGAFIHMYYDGVLDLNEEQIKKMLQGEFPPEARAHTTPRFETGHEKYRWLNKLKAAAIGKVVRKPGEFYVDYSVYALR